MSLAKNFKLFKKQCFPSKICENFVKSLKYLVLIEPVLRTNRYYPQFMYMYVLYEKFGFEIPICFWCGYQHIEAIIWRTRKKYLEGCWYDDEILKQLILKIQGGRQYDT